MAVKSKLSDTESEEVIAYVLAGKHLELITYINTLMYSRGLGTEVCARPYAFRDETAVENPCFAKPYLQLILSFLTEQAAREPNNVVQPTKDLITGMIKEIDKHFSK